VSADTEGVLAAERVTLTPTERDGERIYAYRGKFSFGGLFDGTIGPHLLASPMPASWNQIASWLKQIDSLRHAA
jgi:hypothetical protein